MKTWGRVLCLVWALACGCGAGPAQAATDEATVVKLIVDGRYEELRSLEAAAKGDDPVAQFWWGRLLQGCVYERCEPEQAWRLWVKSARGGYWRAREALFGTTPPGEEMADLIKRIGEPVTTEEKIFWTLSVQQQWNTAEAAAQDKVIAIFKQAASGREPTMFTLVMSGMWDLSSIDTDTLRATISGGVPTGSMMSDVLRRKLRIGREKFRYEELLPQAKSGDLAITTALCETVGVFEGQQHLDAQLLPLCIRAFESGQLGIAPVLLAHYLDLGDMAGARRYADYCLRAPIRCGEPLTTYLSTKFGKSSREWRDWEAELALQSGADASEVKSTREIYRRGLSRAVRVADAARQCMARKYSRETRSFTDSAGCPWGKPPQ